MSVYARTRVVVESSEFSSYVRPQKHSIEAAIVGGKAEVARIVKAGLNGAAVTIDLAQYTGGIKLLVLEHLDVNVTDNVTVQWTDSAAVVCTAVLQSLGVPLVLPDIDYSADITLESAAATTPVCGLTVIGD